MTITDEQEQKLRHYLDQITACRAKLSDWERGFFDDQVNRYKEYGARMSLSPKQWAVLDKMFAKVTEC